MKAKKDIESARQARDIAARCVGAIDELDRRNEASIRKKEEHAEITNGKDLEELARLYAARQLVPVKRAAAVAFLEGKSAALVEEAKVFRQFVRDRFANQLECAREQARERLRQMFANPQKIAAEAEQTELVKKLTGLRYAADMADPSIEEVDGVIGTLVDLLDQSVALDATLAPVPTPA